MSRKKKPELKPTPYWLEQKDKLLSRKVNNLVTDTGAPLPPIIMGPAGLGKTAEFNPLPPELLLNRLIMGVDPKDKAAADDFVAQMNMLAIAGVNGYPITETWYEPPEALGGKK